jgi:hypothetical protein
MKAFQLRTFLVLLTVGLGMHAASASQNEPGTASTGAHTDVTGSSATKSVTHTGAVNERLPGISDEEEIPAFLRVDMCNTGDW